MSCSLCEPLGAALQKVGRFALVHPQAAGVCGIKVLQLEMFALCDAERVDVFLDAVEDFLSRHGANSLSQSPGLASAPEYRAGYATAKVALISVERREAGASRGLVEE